MCIKTELLITFDKYIELIGGKKYETHQKVVDIFNKINKRQKVLDQKDIDCLLKTYRNDLIFLAWSSLGNNFSFSDGVVRTFCIALDISKSIPSYIYNSIKVIRMKNISGVKIGINRSRNSFIIRLGQEVTPNTSIKIFQDSKDWMVSQMKLALSKTGFLSINEWISAEEDIKEFYPYGIASKSDYGYCLKRVNAHAEEIKKNEDYGISAKDFNSLLLNTDTLSEQLYWLSIYAKDTKRLTFSDRNRLYEIKNFILNKAIDCGVASVIELVKIENPYLLSNKSVVNYKLWAIYSADFLNALSYINIKSNDYLYQYVSYMETIGSVCVNIEDNIFNISILDREKFYEYTLCYLIKSANKHNRSFFDLLCLIYGRLKAKIFFSIDHIPEFLMEKTSENIIPSEIIDETYFWYWVVEIGGKFFYLSYNNNICMQEELKVATTSKSNHREVSNIGSHIEKSLGEVLGDLRINNQNENFPNKLKCLSEINYSWQEYKQLRNIEQFKYWDLYEDVLRLNDK